MSKEKSFRFNREVEVGYSEKSKGGYYLFITAKDGTRVFINMVNGKEVYKPKLVGKPTKLNIAYNSYERTEAKGKQAPNITLFNVEIS